jgi:hypothetical protein
LYALAAIFSHRKFGLAPPPVSACPPSILIVDRARTICYLAVIPALTQLPDITEAFEITRSLVTASEGETG